MHRFALFLMTILALPATADVSPGCTLIGGAGDAPSPQAPSVIIKVDNNTAHRLIENHGVHGLRAGRCEGMALLRWVQALRLRSQMLVVGGRAL